MQNVNPTCAAALAALLMSAGPVLAPAGAETAVVDTVEEVSDAAADAVADAADSAAAAVTETADAAVDAASDAVEAVMPGDATADAAASDDGFASDRERVSYAIGVDIGRSFKSQEIDIEIDLLQEALGAAYAGDDLRQTDEQSMTALRTFQQSMMERQQAQASEAGAANREAGVAFLAENGGRDGVVTTESGLQYEILEEGDGAIASPDDTVQLHYTGKLIDGETFDSSADRGPASFPVTGVIPGFSEGLQLLPIGTKAKLYIPSELAYGDSPQGPGGPGSTLIFDVEMLGIESAPEAPSLAEQIEQAEAQLADDLEMVREQGEQQIADLKAQLEASGGSSTTVGGGDEADVKKKEPMYD